MTSIRAKDRCFSLPVSCIHNLIVNSFSCSLLFFLCMPKKCNTKRILEKTDWKNIAPPEQIRQISICDGWPIIFFSNRETKTFQCPLSEMTQTFLFYPGLKIKDAIKLFLLLYYDVTTHFIYLKCFSYITFFRRGDNAFWLFVLLLLFIDRAVLMYVAGFFFSLFFFR